MHQIPLGSLPPVGFVEIPVTRRKKHASLVPSAAALLVPLVYLVAFNEPADPGVATRCPVFSETSGRAQNSSLLRGKIFGK